MSFFAPFNRLKPCRYGQMLYNFHDIYIGRSLDLYGEYCEGDVEAFRRMVKPGQLVVDVGANIGAHTLFLAQQVETIGNVLAFEPQRILFQTLCANMALNNVTNVFCFPLAVGSQPGKIFVPLLDYTQDNNFGGYSAADFQDGETVPMVTIDGFRLPRCDMIKIDVEGMEQAVLEGARRTIEQFKPTLYVENDRKEKSAALVRMIDSLGYLLYWHTPLYFNPRNFFNNTENVFGSEASVNMICIHRSVTHQPEDLTPVEVPLSDPDA